MRVFPAVSQSRGAIVGPRFAGGKEALPKVAELHALKPEPVLRLRVDPKTICMLIIPSAAAHVSQKPIVPRGIKIVKIIDAINPPTSAAPPATVKPPDSRWVERLDRRRGSGAFCPDTPWRARAPAPSLPRPSSRCAVFEVFVRFHLVAEPVTPFSISFTACPTSLRN